MTRWLQVTAVVVVMLVVAMGTAYAQDKKDGEKKRPDAEEIFKKLDANSDGQLTEEEFLASPRATDKEKAKEMFKKMDKDNNGKVSLEEFKAARSARGDGKRPPEKK